MSPTSPRRGSSPISLAADLELASEVERMSPFHTQLNARRLSDAPGSPVTPASSSSSSPNATKESTTTTTSPPDNATTPQDPSTTIGDTNDDENNPVDTTREWKYEDDTPIPKSTAGPVVRANLRKSSFSSAFGRRFSGLRAEFAKRQDSTDSFMSEPVSYGETNYMSQDLWITQKSLGMVNGERPTSGVRVGGPGGFTGSGYTGHDFGGTNGGGITLGGGSFSNINDFHGNRGRQAWRRRRRVPERGAVDDFGRNGGRNSIDLSARLKTMMRGRDGGARRGEAGMMDKNGITVDEDMDGGRDGWGGMRRRKRVFGRDYMAETKERVWSAAARRKVRDRIKRWWSGRRMRREFFA